MNKNKASKSSLKNGEVDYDITVRKVNYMTGCNKN